jgi:hypothetical protein
MIILSRYFKSWIPLIHVPVIVERFSTICVSPLISRFGSVYWPCSSITEGTCNCSLLTHILTGFCAFSTILPSSYAASPFVAPLIATTSTSIFILVTTICECSCSFFEVFCWVNYIPNFPLIKLWVGKLWVVTQYESRYKGTDCLHYVLWLNSSTGTRFGKWFLRKLYNWVNL